MATAWIGFAGVALGAILGLLPRFWDRRDAQRQRETELARAAAEADARQHSHQTGALMKVARSTNQFLAAWAHADNTSESVGSRDDVQVALDRSAEMMSSWAEALVVVGDDQRRAIIETTLREGARHTGRSAALPELASVVDAGLTRLLGIDPTP